jgi:ATP synthase assembly factor FMC1, mitochondrial
MRQNYVPDRNCSKISPVHFQSVNKMAAQPAKLRALYRSLLRELPPRPILSSPRSPLHERLRENFHVAPPSASKASAPAVEHAEQLLAYFRAQRTYTALLERYNPGMGMDEAERVQLTARRVGMDLPEEYGGTEK